MRMNFNVGINRIGAYSIQHWSLDPHSCHELFVEISASVIMSTIDHQSAHVLLTLHTVIVVPHYCDQS